MTSADRKAAMRGLVEQGWTLQRIGDKFGISRERVRQIVGNVGVRRSARDAIQKNLPLIERLRDQGVAYTEIGKQIGVSASALFRNLDQPSNFHRTIVHGTRHVYNRYGCRCEPCCQASSRYHASRRKLAKRGDHGQG